MPERTGGLQARVGVRLGDLDLDLDLNVGVDQVVAVLGPNGAGKTTLLRALAGLLPLQRGSVVLDGDVLEDVGTGVRRAPEDRPVAVVFQEYLLFPHLSAVDNVAFGLRCRGVARGEARKRARRWLEGLGLADRADARPGELSGGQAQRVALARALATEPRLLLLDEPLSALDVSTRAEVRRDLRRHLGSFPGVRLVVTHDPLEAMALADVLVVLEGGRVVQSGTPAEVSARPRSRYVADLVGVNLWRGRAHGHGVVLEGGWTLQAPDAATAFGHPAGTAFGPAAGTAFGPAAGTAFGPAAGSDEVFALVHPRAVSLHRRPPEGTPRNVWEGVAESLDLEGDRVRVRVGGPLEIVAEVTPAAVAELSLADGGPVWVAVKATEVAVYPA